MDWKEFFRPTWPKLIILFMLLIVFNEITIRVGDISITFYKSIFYKIFYPGSIFEYLKLNEVCPTNSCYLRIIWNVLIGSLSLLLSLLYHFFLSCLLIFIHRKIRPIRSQEISQNSYQQ